MAVGMTVLVFAFVAFASVALGAAMAWLVVWKTKKPIMWALTPLFALLWLLFVAGPLIGLGLYLPYRAAMRTPAPALIPPTPVETETDRMQDSEEEPLGEHEQPSDHGTALQ